jgi:glycosyltransferase involved in cell wall biosynthesis
VRRPELSRDLRVAWFGSVGTAGGGVGAGTLLLSSLAERGVEVDVFYAGAVEDFPGDLAARPNVHVVARDPGWRYDRWYSREPMLAFVTSMALRVRAHLRLLRAFAARHRAAPYDVAFQWSQLELLLPRGRIARLPPLVVHPCTHAAGELRWHRRESAYALGSEGRLRHYLTRAYLAVRAAVQRREVRKPAMIVGPSEVFLGHLRDDYELDGVPTRVLRHPVRVDRFRPAERDGAGRPLTLLFVARMSVRKGLELVVELSHRLADLAGEVRIELAGGATMWSDYRRHLAELNPATATYLGELGGEAIAERYRAADVLLVPSRYEPGSLVVGEALACGLPVVVSDEVGPGEVLPSSCCRVFPSGDAAAFEAAVRQLVAEMREDPAPLRRAAREQACALFAPDVIGEQLHALLAEAAGARRA